MTRIERATYGAAGGYEGIEGGLPAQFPRIIGPRAMEYL